MIGIVGGVGIIYDKGVWYSGRVRKKKGIQALGRSALSKLERSNIDSVAMKMILLNLIHNGNQIWDVQINTQKCSFFFFSSYSIIYLEWVLR